MLDDILGLLLDDAYEQAGNTPSSHAHSRREQIQHYQKHVDHLETSSKLRILHELLCVRSPEPPLPQPALKHLDSILTLQKSHRMLTQAESLPPLAVSENGVRITLWRGDITTLTHVTAITNAANEKALGCFQPTHRCIDNIIHSWAGPRLRAECHELMQARGEDLLPGDALVTKGYNLPAPFVIHTVGPQLSRGAQPTEEDKSQLSRCYSSILDALESLPATDRGSRSVALCCISTGLFAFPAQQAAGIAIKTVAEWLEKNPATNITDIIFNTFTGSDTEIYRGILETLPNGWSPYLEEPTTPVVKADSVTLARQWLESADAVLVTAGAGLSAAEGLDYTSPTLFKRHFPGMLKYGLRTLYSVFGFSRWPSEQDRWGYYFTHLNMVKTWPASPIYKRLLTFLEKFGPDAHVRTSNADGFFLANGWPADQLSTPQGSYAVLQCMKNCRPDAVVESWPLVKDAISSVDPSTQRLTDPDKVPRCQYCGGKMFICVRASALFNEQPFKEGEERWNDFGSRILREGKKLVILELGVGMNTPGVLRWPNEDLTTDGDGNIKLIRAGIGHEVAVPFDLEEAGFATSIEGDLKETIDQLFD
ncbi:hypothetical protein B0T10DRAFT_538452 [Thelonectria olida]|uniref:Macro domain-containing protein n=1 Tax=Thelonectria olida TaxID=1576542 RepID=A0A9P9APW9_9HYPO|nr:hypothetical protein B0T10DRAFT_538452 [Thelonectria olida]